MAKVDDQATIPAPSTAAWMPSFRRDLTSPEAGVLGDLLRLGFVAQLCLASFDVDQALQLACRFSPLWSQYGFQYERSADDVQVRAAPEASDEVHPFDSVDAALIFRRLVGRISDGRVAPSAIEAPSYQLTRIRRLLDCALEPSERGLSIRFSAEDVRYLNPQFDPALVHLLTAHGEQRITSLREATSTRARARDAMNAMAASGASVRADLLARSLGLSARTLHRRLQAEGTSFRALLAEHQLALSVSQLASSATSAKQVAFDLGFADPASFHRAFKRWTGHTVSQHRAQQKRGVATR